MDEKAFEERVLALEPKLYRTACAMLWNDADAADAMQECILKAWRKQDSLRDPERFSAWTMRILINECRNVQRRGRYRAVPLEEAMSEREPVGGETIDLGLRQALRALPPKLRLPLLLHHMDGYSLEEIAGMLRLPVSTIKGRLYEARKRLRALLEKEAF
ncbi:MAG: RNA polymerase sigma factor [Eubacteriales bacterium]|nr:RNA polymerase sigma factor [Eubacteriales bacterium]